MKKTIITLAAATLALSSVNAQTFADLSGFDATLINSASGQDFALLSGSVNIRRTSGTGNTLQQVAGINSLRSVFGTGATTFDLTFTGLSGHDIFVTDFEGLGPAESGSFSTDGEGFVLESLGNGFYDSITGVGTDTVSFQGNVSNGNGLEFSSRNATLITWTVPDGSNNGFRVGASPVPEPSSALLLGLGALGFFSRRKR